MLMQKKLYNLLTLGGFALNLTGEGFGVGGGTLSSPTGGVRLPGGPRMTSRTGKKTRPLNRPRTIKATRTRKKYLKYNNY